jgi:hypothetical protein
VKDFGNQNRNNFLWNVQFKNLFSFERIIPKIVKCDIDYDFVWYFEEN